MIPVQPVSAVGKAIRCGDHQFFFRTSQAPDVWEVDDCKALYALVRAVSAGRSAFCSDTERRFPHRPRDSRRSDKPTCAKHIQHQSAAARSWSRDIALFVFRHGAGRETTGGLTDRRLRTPLFDRPSLGAKALPDFPYRRQQILWRAHDFSGKAAAPLRHDRSSRRLCRRVNSLTLSKQQRRRSRES
jgi:hypothetical protein